MKLTKAMTEKLSALSPGDDGSRIILDPRGIHHRTIPSRNFAHTVANHAELRNLSAAEALYIIERLTALGAVGPETQVSEYGAVVQAFYGTAGREACHTMPCQLVLDDQFPHQLRNGDGQAFNTTFLHRTVQLFARCTLQPAVVNAIDKVLDRSKESDFVTIYLGSVRAVPEPVGRAGAGRAPDAVRRHVAHGPGHLACRRHLGTGRAGVGAAAG